MADKIPSEIHLLPFSIESDRESEENIDLRKELSPSLLEGKENCIIYSGRVLNGKMVKMAPSTSIKTFEIAKNGKSIEILDTKGDFFVWERDETKSMDHFQKGLHDFFEASSLVISLNKFIINYKNKRLIDQLQSLRKKKINEFY